MMYVEMRKTVVGALILVAALAPAKGAPPRVATPEGRAPSDAVVVFDGTGKEGLVNGGGKPLGWEIRNGELIVNGENGAFSTQQFQDAQIHVEFLCPKDGKKGGAAGNSGLYIHGLYELQIHNSYDEQHDPEYKGMLGAIYGQHTPAINVARPAEQWQVYDIIFRAPRRGGNGIITQPGRVTVLLNGVLLHDHAKLEEPTVYGPLIYKPTAYANDIRAKVEKEGTGPLFLQDHGSPVRFRNIWIRLLTNGSD